MESATCYSAYDRNEGTFIEGTRQKDASPLILIVEEDKENCEQIKNLLDKEFSVVITLNSRHGKEDLAVQATRTRMLHPKEISSNVQHAIHSIKEAQQRIYKRNDLLRREESDPQRDDFIRKASGIVTEHLNDSAFNVAVLCKELSISRMQLHRKLKFYTGQSTSEFIRSIRLKRAAKLFQTGQMKVIEVMYEIGIESCSYFTKAFKNQFNCTPSQYASSCKKRSSHELSVV